MKYLIVTSLLISIAVADIDSFQVNGFGTIGMTYQNNEDIIYTPSWRYDRGTDGTISIQNDSRFGLQLDWQASEKIDFTLQGTVDCKGANLEWANIKYTIDDHHDIKIGQMRFPTAMYSDILKVSYSYNWVRLPEDVYGILPLTSYVGAEYNYRNQYADTDYHLKLYLGHSEDTMIGSQDIGDYTIELDHLFGINLSFTKDSLHIRVGYTHTKISIENTRVNQYFDQLLSNHRLSPDLKALLDYYDPRSKATDYLSFGFKYDQKQWYLLGEYVWINMNNIISDNYAGYLSAGYHFGAWTPHITYSEVTGTSNYTKPVNDPLMDDALKEMSQRTMTTQSHITLGVRYDWRENVALKLQYDHIEEENKGRGISIHKELPYRPETINLISLSMDFIF